MVQHMIMYLLIQIDLNSATPTSGTLNFFYSKITSFSYDLKYKTAPHRNTIVNLPSNFQAGDSVWGVKREYQNSGDTTGIRFVIDKTTSGVSFTITNVGFVSGNQSNYDFENNTYSSYNLTSKSGNNSGYGVIDLTIQGNVVKAGYFGAGVNTDTLPYTKTLTTVQSLDGRYDIVATAIDESNNTASDTTTNELYIKVPLQAPTINTPIIDTNTSTPTVTGSCEANATVTLMVDGTAVTPTATCDNNGTYSITPDNNLSDGNKTFIVSQIDRNGDRNPTSISIQVIIDTIPPTQPIVNSVVDRNSSTPTVTGSCEAGATVTLMVDGTAVTPTATCDSNGTYSITPDNNLSDGNKTFTVTQTDSAGNTSPVSSSMQVIIDATPPAQPTVDIIVDANSSKPTVKGSCEAGATVTLMVDGTAIAPTVTCENNGTYSITPDSNLSDGNKTFAVTQTDSAGNRSPVSSSKQDTTDTTPPVITLNDINLAHVYGEATQGTIAASNYRYYSPASKAIDGDLSTYNHTRDDNSENWLQIKLPTDAKISKIIVNNRTGGIEKLRLRGAKVYLQNSPYNGTLNTNNAVKTLQGVATPQETLFTTPRSASYVIVKADNNFLHLTELEVYGALTDTNSVTVEIGKSFTDPGAIAVDNMDSNVSVTVSGSVNTSIVGTYTLTYTATDSSGNEASITRIIRVVDTRPPTLTIKGDNPVTIEAGATYTDAGAEAVDNIDGNLTGSIVIKSDVNTSRPGDYSVTYSIQDSAGNEANATRVVRVASAASPVITIKGRNPITIEVGTTYIDAGATAVDIVDGNLTSSIVTISDVNTSRPGDYNVTYSVRDNVGNETNATRVVRVVSAASPVITIKGTNPITVEAGNTYTDAGAEAVDNVDGVITSLIVTTSDVNISRPGDYSVTYSVRDNAGNETNATRIVRVRDTTPPTLTLIGNTPIIIQIGDTYTDLGAEAVDSIDGNLTSSIVTTNNINTSRASDYNVTYSVRDSSGNEANATRVVRVIDNAFPLIIIKGENPVTVEVGTTYIDAGAEAVDSIDGNLTSSIVTTGDVNISRPSDYAIIYSVRNSAGNEINTTRVVRVVDTTPPTLTLIGDNPVLVKVGTTYQEPGAEANDTIDGNLTGFIIVDRSSVDTSIVGKYMVRYSVSDSAGNEATATREVIILENPIKKTAQIVCYDSRNVANVIDCKDDNALKSDGYYKKGVATRYIRDDDKEVVIDKVTGLMWQDNSEAATTNKQWDDAKSYCDNLTLAGYNDWRMPNIRELKNILNRGASNSVIDNKFTNTYAGVYYSSSEVINSANNNIWCVSFSRGNDTWYNKSYYLQVRCVRNN